MAPFVIDTATIAEPKSTPTNKTMAGQANLPHLPVPPLEDTMKRYLKALEGLQVGFEFLCFLCIWWWSESTIFRCYWCSRGDWT